MRFRITVRGEGVELRGFIDGEAEELNAFAGSVKPWVVDASPAEADYDPFKEQELRELHHFEVEQENERLKANLEQERAEHESTLHTGQAYMEENERLKDDHTESEKVLIDQVNKQRDVIERIIAARSNHPECEKHPDDDEVKCGWKIAVQDIDRALSDVSA